MASYITRWGYNTDTKQFFRERGGVTVHYTRGDLLGKSVYVLTPDKKGFREKAIKMSPSEDEFNILSSLGGRMAKVFVKGDPSMMVMTKYDGTLEQYLPKLTLKTQRLAIEQLLAGIKKLHKEGIWHKDILLKNIFYKKRGKEITFHLGDFGCSKINYQQKTGDIRYLALVFKSILLKKKLELDELEPLTTDQLRKGLPKWILHLTNNALENDYLT